jgi:hypothetical protein
MPYGSGILTSLRGPRGPVRPGAPHISPAPLIETAAPPFFPQPRQLSRPLSFEDLGARVQGLASRFGGPLLVARGSETAIAGVIRSPKPTSPITTRWSSMTCCWSISNRQRPRATNAANTVVIIKRSLSKPRAKVVHPCGFRKSRTSTHPITTLPIWMGLTVRSYRSSAAPTAHLWHGSCQGKQTDWPGLRVASEEAACGLCSPGAKRGLSRSRTATHRRGDSSAGTGNVGARSKCHPSANYRDDTARGISGGRLG